MTDTIYRRAQEIALYLIETGDTVRGAAARFGVSKSTVFKDLTERLEECGSGLFPQVRQVLERNKAERHLRGGEATRRKFSDRRGRPAQTDIPD